MFNENPGAKSPFNILGAKLLIDHEPAAPVEITSNKS